MKQNRWFERFFICVSCGFFLLLLVATLMAQFAPSGRRNLNFDAEQIQKARVVKEQ